jgi:hypothetical protein
MLQSCVAEIRRLRSENGRQFLVGCGSLSLWNNELGDGAWDPQYALVQLAGRTDLDWRGNQPDPQKGIITIAAKPADQCSFSGDAGSGRWADREPDWSLFTRGVFRTNVRDGLGALVAGGTPDAGAAFKFGSSIIVANLAQRDFGDGTMLFVRDARPGCPDLLNDPLAHGTGAIAVKIGGRWQSLAVGA